MKPNTRAALALPALAAAVVLVGVPAAATLVLSFLRYDGLSAPEWAGLGNFRRLASDPLFAHAVRNSVLFSAVAVPLRLAIAVGAGLLLTAPRPQSGARALVLLPAVAPDVAYGIAWLWLVNPVYGPLAPVLARLGLPAGALVLTPWGARGTLVLLAAFQAGEMALVVSAVRRSLPAELFELAALEGAGRVALLRTVTLPLLSPVLALLAARDVVWSLQASFVPALVVTQGGPNHATYPMSLHAYRTAFEFLRFGEAAAATVPVLAVTATAALACASVLSRRGSETP